MRKKHLLIKATSIFKKFKNNFFYLHNLGKDYHSIYTRTDFVPKEIAKTRPKIRFNTNKSEVAEIHCVV